MKKVMMVLLTLLVSLTAASAVWAGPFENYYDYENPDQTYTYYFDQGSGVFVTMDKNWYQKTLVKPTEKGAAFYHKASNDAYIAEGVEEGGGWMFTLRDCPDDSYKELPEYEYIGFDEAAGMNYYAQLPTDYRAYMRDEGIRAEYDALMSEVEDVLAGITIGAGTDTKPETSGTETIPDYIPDIEPPEIFESGDYAYQINDDGSSVTIAGYTGNEDEIEIPSEIDGYQVTGIGPEAFSYYKMKSLVFPDSISRIGGRAFEYCEVTSLLQLPENAALGWDAFAYAELPARLVIPEGVMVEGCAFSYCDTIEQVFVGADVVIGSRAFGYCDSLEQVVCAPGSTVEEDAFEYCRAMENIILCDPVTVDEGAFPYCGEAERRKADESEFDALLQADAGTDSSETGSSPTENPAEDVTGGWAGGWEETADAAVTDELKSLFDQAVQEVLDVYYEPVALLATQVVAGTNYCFLAREISYEDMGDPHYMLIYIWQRPGEDPELLEMQDLEFGLRAN